MTISPLRLLPGAAALLCLSAVATAQPASTPGQDPTTPTPTPAPGAPVAEDAEEAQESPADSSPVTTEAGIETLDIRTPPLLWQSWEIGGQLTESERKTLRAFFTGPMASRQPLTQAGREELGKFASRIGYHLVEIQEVKTPAGATEVILYLDPFSLVRRVDVEADNAWTDPFNAVFSDEITRRMRLRAGAPLARDPLLRREQFEREKSRIKDYLYGEGYFEAVVTIVGDPAGRNAVDLDIDIVKGPRYQIGQVEVTGNQAVDDREIVEKFRHGQICLFGVCLFERFSRQNLNRDVERVVELYQKRGFPAVRVRTDYDPGTSPDRLTRTVNFNVVINERRKVSVVFEGNDPRRFPTDTLQKLLTFDEEGSYDEVEIVASAEAIRQHYQSRGYFEANVTFERERFPILDRIVFSIDQGTQLAVRGVTIEGNRSISTPELQSLMRTRVQDSSPFFGRVGYTTSTRLHQDAQRIAQHYQTRGFADAEVTIQVSRSSRDQGSAPALAALVAAGAASQGLFIRFVIDEGPRTAIERLEFDGATVLRDRLMDQLQIRAGQPYDRNKVAAGVQELKRFYFRQAYPRAEIRVQEEPGSAGNSVVVRYQIKENGKVRFGDVLVQGNFRTDEWIIRDELGFANGDPLSLGQAERGQQNLRSSGLFNAVQVSFIDLEDGTDDRVNVLVQVEERHDYRLGGEVAGGYSSDRGVFVELGVLNANLLGKGMRLDLRGQYATKFNDESEFQSVEGKLTAPRWITRRLSGGLFAPRMEIAAFLRQEPTERFGALTSFGTSLALSRLGRGGFFENWLFTLRYDLRQRNRTEDLVRRAGPSDDLEQDDSKKTRTGAIGPQILIDRRRDADGRLNPLAPVSGFKIELRALLAHRYLAGEDDFIKLGASAQQFWKPFGRVLLSNGIRYDQGIPIGGVVLPEVERFFAGGDTTVRGFEEDRLATELIESPIPPFHDVTQIRVLPAGGNLRFIHNIDLQVELGELGNFPVASAIFLDTGLVTNSLEDFAPGDLRHALGVALIRWVTPLSSLSLEWAIPLDPQRGDDPRGRYHLNLGLLF